MAKGSKKDVQAQLEKLLREIGVLKKAAEKNKLEFVSLDEKELINAIKRKSSNSPFPFGATWNSGLVAGSLSTYSITMNNPDPVDRNFLVVSIFWGIANFLDDIGIGIAGRDTRWPYLSTPTFTLASGATGTQTFNYIIPAGIPPSTYYGNAVLWSMKPIGIGTYLARSVFYVRVL